LILVLKLDNTSTETQRIT